MKASKILLASSSLYRRQVLQKLGLEFAWAAPNIDESPMPGERAIDLVARLAAEKARSLATQYSDHLIIGSDQVATLDGNILGKPHTHSVAKNQLSSFRKRDVFFLTGLSLYNAAQDRIQISVETYNVSFRDLSAQQIDNYLNREKPYDCAGSFKAEGLGISLFSALAGEDPNTLIGLPLIALIRMLNNEGVDPLA